jgi:hypothetical protein
MAQQSQGVRHCAEDCMALGYWQQRLDGQETQGTLAVHMCTKAGWRLLKKKSLCKKSWGIAQSEQKPAKNNDKVANRTLSLKRTFISTEADNQPQAWQMHAGIWKQPHRFFVTVKALATLRFRQLGCHFMKSGDYEDISVSRILHLVQGAGLLNSWAKRLQKRSKTGKCTDHCSAHHSVF